MAHYIALAYATEDGHRVAVLLLNADTGLPDIAFGKAVQAAITTAYSTQTIDHYGTAFRGA